MICELLLEREETEVSLQFSVTRYFHWNSFLSPRNLPNPFNLKGAPTAFLSEARVQSQGIQFGVSVHFK